MFVDSHCHLNLLELNKLKLSLAEVIQEALDHGVTQLISVATHIDQHLELIDIARKFSTVKISAGIHPEYAPEVNIDELLDPLLKVAASHEVIGIGETGLDYYYIEKNLDYSAVVRTKKLQQALFALQINVAKQLNKPLIVHTRMASEDTIDILTKEQAYITSGVMHCFTENWETAKKALDLGFYISFSGIITFKNKVTDLLEIVKKVPLERILIETDSPFLAPYPYRGQINRPSNVVHVANKIAELKNISPEKVGEITASNYRYLFNIK